MFKNINKGEWILIPVRYTGWNPKILNIRPNIMNECFFFPAIVKEVGDDYFIVLLDKGFITYNIRVEMDGSINDVNYYKAFPLTLRIYEKYHWIRDYIEAYEKKNSWCKAMNKFIGEASTNIIKLRDSE